MSAARRFEIAGVRLDAMEEADIVAQVAGWCRRRDGRPRTLCLVNAFSIVAASRDGELKTAMNDSDLSIVDGVPVAWVGRRLTGGPCDRLSGPDLMHRLLTEPEYADIKHFVYGGEQEALTRLEFRYNRGGTATPRRVVGTHAPPFRDLTAEEERAVLERLEALRPDILWVCLGTSRQEKWLARMRSSLEVPVLAGVGAAVDFLSGSKPRAPVWLQRLGLEWLFRLVTEPRRLWRRYLIGNIVFLRLAGGALRRRTAHGDLE